MLSKPKQGLDNNSFGFYCTVEKVFLSHIFKKDFATELLTDVTLRHVNEKEYFGRYSHSFDIES